MESYSLWEVFHGEKGSLSIGMLAGAPQLADAIPLEGDYEFTSGLTGTFHSDGSQLTTWAITDPFMQIWASSNSPYTVVSNNASDFEQGTLLTPPVIHIYWDFSYYASYSPNSNDARAGYFAVRKVSNVVPEPSTGLLLLGGLGLLAGYGLR